MVQQRVLRVTTDTLFKLRPEQSSQLSPDEVYSVKAHTPFEIQSYAFADAGSEFNGHIKFTLLDTTIRNISTWYVYKLHAQVEFDSIIVYPPEAKELYFILRINDDTFLKRRPLQSSELPDAEKYFIKKGHSFPLQSYVYGDASGNFNSHIRFALRYREDYIRDLSTWYIYDRHGYIEYDGKVVYPPEDPNLFTLRINTDTLFKRRPLQSSQLAANEVSPVTAGNTFPLLSYAYADATGQRFNGHIKVAFKYAKDYIDGLNTWYVYEGHAQVEQRGKKVYPLTTSPTAPSVTLKGADSLSRVTSSAIINEATRILGTKPLYWGRYFSGSDYFGPGEYFKEEGSILRANGIRLLPVARYTTQVSLGQAEGLRDGNDQARDFLVKLGESYLKSQGGSFYFFLDVELSDPLSTSYYIGWSQAVKNASSRVSLLPCVYLNANDAKTSTALANAMQQGAECNGLWIAFYDPSPTIAGTQFDSNKATPATRVSAPVVLWQFVGDVQGTYDFNLSNPSVDSQMILSRLAIPPTI